MSIKIIKENCVGCGRCVDVCPGGLLEVNHEGKVDIPYPKDCWGCAACMKECPNEAILYYLAEDMGGRGGYLIAKDKVDTIDFIYIKGDTQKKFTVNRKSANKY